ncbi:O-antigen ligase family protein [Rheinheimera sp.]|uniref:O-antigen ligase family protein n=1 Tax=Rheinheimera sp. TaxID=1869214 RepID=UPI002FDCF490
MNEQTGFKLPLLDLLIILLAKWYLLIDAANGVVLSLSGQSVPLSALYKSALLVLLFCALLRDQVRGLLVLMVLAILLLAGPFYTLLQTGNSNGFSYDAGMVLKLLSPLLAALYFFHFSKRSPVQAQQALHQIFLFSFTILVLNMLLGRLGFGFSAYLPNDYLPDLNLGTKGYFKATNELSALLLVLSGYLLACYWPVAKLKFVLVLGLSLFAASSMLTKTGMAGVLLLALLIPLLQEKDSWLKYRRQLLILPMLLALGVLLLYWQWPVLLASSVGQKLQLVYQQQGVLGVLLSSRDQYALDNWLVSSWYFADWHRLAGIGNTGLEIYSSKALAEIDPVDLLLWFGLAGLSYFLLWFALILKQSWHAYLLAPRTVVAGIFVLNLVLLLVATMAGHVLTSGMLWIPWGMLNGAVWLYIRNLQEPLP